MASNAKPSPPAMHFCKQLHKKLSKEFFRWSNSDMRLVSIGGGADEVMLSIICKYMGTLPKGKSEKKSKWTNRSTKSIPPSLAVDRRSIIADGVASYNI